MFQSLYGKLALALFILLCIFGIVFSLLMHHTSVQYQQEATQRLNESLADHVIAEIEFFKDVKSDKAIIKDVFHMLMVINQSIEVYQLDTKGNILNYAAPAKKVVRKRIDITPVKQFINKSHSYPILGDDPRNLELSKAFSAAPIIRNGELKGYIYIILEGERYASIVDVLQGSYIMRLSIWAIVIILLITFVVGLLIFYFMTRRLRKLSGQMQESSQDNEFHLLALNKAYPKDEVGQLSLQFNKLIKTINRQINALRNVDKVRRDLIANVSHDLRTPITTLQGYLETLLIKRNELSETQKAQYLKISIEHSKHLSRLVAELFELAKLDSCESIISAEPFSLAELIQDIIQKFTLKAHKKGIKLRYQYKNQPGLVFGDIGMMQRALENLIENALRHTSKEGIVMITVKTTPQKVIVVVSDTGCGIEKAELSHIFNRFYRVDKSRTSTEGSGLGLAITKRILELHGSKINVTSKVNEGTRFSFQISTYQSQSSQDKRKDKPSQNKPIQKELATSL